MVDKIGDNGEEFTLGAQTGVREGKDMRGEWEGKSS